MKKWIDHRSIMGKGVIYDRHDLNQLYKFVNERLDHFLTKAILFYILRQHKHDVVSEVEILGIGQCDLFDLTTSIQYEVETSINRNVRNNKIAKYSRKDIDVIVIDCNKLLSDINERYKQLKEYVVI